MKINNHRHGFVMIQIIIAIFISISVVSGTAFVAFEAGQEAAENTTQPTTEAASEAEIESAPDKAIPEDEAATGEEDVAGEPSEPAEPEDTSTPPTELTTATTSASTSTGTSTRASISEEGEGVDEDPEGASIETGTSTTTSASVGITTTPPTTSHTTSIAQDFKESALASVTVLLNSYNTTTKWIDGGIMFLLPERERILDGLISNTQKLMESSPDPLLLYVYGLFIEAYNFDKSQIVDSYRTIFFGIKERMNTKNISALNTEHEKLSAASSISKTEYDTLTQLVKQHESDLQSVHNEEARSTLIQYVSRIGFNDEIYQQLWAKLPAIISDPANNTQNLEKILNQLEQLRLGQPKPL